MNDRKTITYGFNIEMIKCVGGEEKGKKMGRKKGTIEILKEDKQIEKHNDMNKDVQLKGLINFALNCVEQV